MNLNGRTIVVATVISIVIGIMSGCRKSAQTYSDSSYDTAMNYINKCVDSFYTNPEWMHSTLDSIRQQAPDSATKQLACLYDAFCHFLVSNNSQVAIRQIDSVRQFCLQHPEVPQLHAAYWNIRSILSNNTDSTIYCLEQASRFIEQSNRTRGMITVSINLADIYRISGHLPEAARYWIRALTLCDSIHQSKPKPDILIGLAQTYSDMGRYDMADTFFAQVDTSITPMRTNYLLNMAQGNSYYARNDYEKALLCFRKAFEYTGQAQADLRLIPLYADLAETYTLIEQYDSASHYLSMASQRLQGTVVPGASYFIYSISADLAFRQHRDAEANRFLDSLRQCGDAGLTYRFQHKRRMMRHFARIGDYERAYKYRDEMEQYDDSIRDMQQQANLAEIDYRYQRDTTLLRQRLLLSESNEKVLYGRLTLAIMIVILLVFVAITSVYIIQRRRRSYVMQQKARGRIAELRMQGVRNRVTPHMILNAMHTARLQTSNPVCEHLIDVLRDNLTTSDDIQTTLDDELRIVEHYFELHRLTHAVCPTLNIHRDPSAIGTLLLPSMSIQIPVENALKHAFSDGDTDRRIDISLEMDSDTLKVRITDNGHGYDPSRGYALHEASGNGLYILYQTFDLLNQFNSSHIRFEIVSPVSNNRGTRVELDVPQNFNYTFNTDNKK